MINWFKRKKREINATELSKIQLHSIDYPAKIILAWSKAIEGNDDILFWLKNNGYEELVMATYAIYLKDEARDWLQANGYAHLLAMVNACEGNESAQKWLETHDFQILHHIALAVDHDDDSVNWLMKNTTPDLILLAMSIRKVKDQIEENHNDIHSFGKDA